MKRIAGLHALAAGTPIAALGALPAVCLVFWASGCNAVIGLHDVPPPPDGGAERLMDASLSDARVDASANDAALADGTVNLDAGASADVADSSDAADGSACASPLLVDAIAVATGSQHACALRAAGTVVCWGDNSYGQLGVPPAVATQTSIPQTVRFPADAGTVTIRAIAIGALTSYAVDSQLRVWAWGDNGSGQLGIGTIDKSAMIRDVPALVMKGSSPLLARTLAVGLGYACAIEASGTISCWGTDGYMQLGPAASTGGTGASDVPTAAFGNGSFVQAPTAGALLGAGGSAYATCYTPGGTNAQSLLSCWGLQGGYLPPYAGTGNSGFIYQADVYLEDAGAAFPLRAISMGQIFGCAIDARNTTYCWGDGRVFFSPDAGDVAPRATRVDGGTAQIAAGLAHLCLIDGAGKVYCQGNGSNGELGDGVADPFLTNSKLQIVHAPDGGTLTASSVASGDEGSCVIVPGPCGADAGGSVVCWGTNDHQQVGAEAGATISGPVFVQAPAP